MSEHTLANDLAQELCQFVKNLYSKLPELERAYGGLDRYDIDGFKHKAEELVEVLSTLDLALQIAASVAAAEHMELNENLKLATRKAACTIKMIQGKYPWTLFSSS